MKDPRLGLRGNAQEVHLVMDNAQTKPVIGTSEPATDPDGHLAGVQARVRAVAHWGAQPSPRLKASVGVVQPLTLRSRTILWHRLAPGAQAAINRGLNSDTPVPDSGVVAKVVLNHPD